MKPFLDSFTTKGFDSIVNSLGNEAISRCDAQPNIMIKFVLFSGKNEMLQS